MLRIKKDVSLEKLEEYGFIIVNNHNSDYYQIKIKDFNTFKIIIKPISREILIDTGANYINNLNLLFDLIQDGLVEKVEEE